MSNLLFNYDELVRGGDSSFAVDYMVERILEEDAIYAEPTQEVIEKVGDLANFSSPEDADEYIWEWLDGLAEEKGTWVYTIMFDQIWVSDGSSYDLHDYDFDEEEEEAIKFAGNPLEEKHTLSETHIKREFFENLIDKFANEGYTYYPLDRYAVDFSRISFFLWLEQQAGDNVKAFTFNTIKKASGDITGISLYSMPGERYYYFDNATEEDVELLAGAGQLNESIKGWDKDVDFSNPEDLADALVKAEASFIDPGFFYEEIAIDVDRSDDDADYEDIYYEALAQALFDAYGDDKLYYTFYYDDPSENYIMLFSDGEYAYIEDSYNWTEDDYEMITGAGMLEESYGKHAGWDDGVKWGTDTDYVEVADRLADIGAKYIDMPERILDFYLNAITDTDDEAYEILANKFTDEYGSKDVLYFSKVEASDGEPTFVFSDDTYWVGYNLDDEGVELVTGAGMLNENKTPLQNLKSISTRSGYELADTLADIGAHYVELPDSDIAYLEDLDYEVRDEELYKVLDKILSNSDHEVIFTYFPYDETFNIATATFNEVFYLQDFDDVSGQEAIDLITGAGQLNEAISEAWDDGIEWGMGQDVEEAADRLVEMGAKFIYFDFDPGELNQTRALYYFEDVADLMSEKYGMEDTLYYSFEDFHDGNELHKAFVFSDGDHVDVSLWDESDIELVKGAGELLQESLADKPTYVKIEALANDVVEQDLQYYQLSNDEREDLIELAAMIGDGKQPIAKWDKTIINILKKQRSKTGKEHYTVTPTMTQIQYPEEQVIDFMYFDEFLTRFLPNADKSDLELLRGAGQLNEIESSSWWRKVDWTSDFRAESLADVLAEMDAEYIPAEDINLPNKERYEGDENGYASDSAYELKIHAKAKGVKNLLFSIIDIGSDVYFISSDGFDYDLWDFSSDDIDLIIGAGQLNEYDTNWDEGIDFNTEISAEKVADRLVEIGAKYVEVTADIEPEEEYHETFRDYLDKMAELFSEKYGHEEELYFTYYVDDDAFIFSDGTYWYDEAGFLSDDVDLIIGAGQLQEQTISDYPNGSYATEVADFIADNNATYHEITSQEQEDIIQAWDDDRGDDEIEDILKRHKKPNTPVFTWIELSDQFAMLFNDGNIEFYSMYEFKDVDTHPTKGSMDEAWELIIGAGQLNEQNTSKWHKGIDWDRMSPEDIADALVKADAVYVHPDKFEQDSRKAEKFNPKYHLKNFGLIEPIVDLFGELYSSDILHYTIFNDPLRQYTDKFITNRGEFWNVAPDGDDWTEEDYDMVIGAGQLNENQTLTEDEYPDPESAEDIADFLSKNGATFHELTSDEIDVIGDAWAYGGSRSGQEAGYQTTKDILKKHKEAGRPIFTYDEGSGGMFYILFNDGTGGAYYLEGFEDMEEPEAYDLIINAGNLYEEEKKYVDPLASMTDSSSGLELADALANAGARYIDAEWLDKIEYARWNDKAPRNPEDYIGDVMDELKNEFKKDDTIIFTYFEPDHVFITWDGKYYDEFYMEDFTDLSGTADVRMIIDAGMLNEAIDLEDNKIGDMIDAYTYDIYSLIDPMGANQGNVQDLSNAYMYKYGDSQNPADYYMENSWNTDLPKPIAKTFEGLIESSFIKERALDYAREEFLGKHPEVEQEFYGMHDELDPDIFRDAGYDELADELENDIKEQEAAFLEDDYEIIFGSAINTNFDRDPESIYVHVYCKIYEFSDRIILKEVDLGVTYNNIKTVEDFRNAMKDFMTEKISAFLNGEPPAEIHSDEEVDESKKPLNESIKFEELIDNVTEWPLHYVDLQDTLEAEMIDHIITGGVNVRDKAEVDEYIWTTVADYLDKLDRKAGYIDSEGQPETDEGYFTMLGSDFYEELGYFVDGNEWELYTSNGLLDTYSLTGEQVDDVIEAGQIYDNPLKEQEEEETEYNPTFEQIDEMIENATEELIYQVGQSFDGWGDPGVERLESGDGAIRFADGGFRSHDSQNINMMYGQYRMPTKEADTKIGELYDELYAEASKIAVDDLKRTHPDVYAEFAGDPEVLTYRELEDAGEAYADVDPERSKMYYDAAEELDQATNDVFYEDDDAIIYFEVEIQYKQADYPDGDYLEPELTFRGTVETNYKPLAAKEVTKTFTSEEELEQALEEGTKEIEEWFDGSEYGKEVGINESMDPDAEDIYDKLSKEADSVIKPIMINPEKVEDVTDDTYSSFSVLESYPVDLMKYLNGDLNLPEEFDPSTISNLEDSIYDVAEGEVLNNFEDYIPQDRWQEFIGLEDDLRELYKSGDLEDIDPELYEDIKNWVNEKYADYQNDSGVERSLDVFVDDQEKKIQLNAVITVDPEYDKIKEKKTKVLNFDQVDEAIEFMMDMALWLQGK